MTMTQVGGFVTLIAIAGALIGLIALHVAPTGLSPFRDPVSQYGITRFKALYALAAIGAGVAGIGTILVLAALPGSIAAVVLLALFAAARILIPFFPMDAPGAPKSGVGRVHNLLAFVAFGSVTAAAFVAGGLLHDNGYPELATIGTVFAVIMAVGAVLLLLTRVSAPLRGAFGAAERLIYLGFLGWFIAIGVTAVGSTG